MAAKIAKFHGFTTQTRHEHDCMHCKFLGSINESDMYVCERGKEKTYILRDGSEGHDYRSAPAKMAHLFPEGSEYRLAEKLDNHRRKPAMYYTY